MQLVRPGPEHLTSYVAALERGWSADNERGVEAAREELSRIEADAAAFLASMEDREAKGPPLTLPDGSTAKRVPGFKRWLWTANSAAASGCGGNQVLRRYRPIVWGISAMRSCRGGSTAGMQSQRYASYFRKPRQSACRTWRSPLIRTTSRHSVSSKRMEASSSSTSSNRSSSAASLACAFASCSHTGV